MKNAGGLKGNDIQSLIMVLSVLHMEMVLIAWRDMTVVLQGGRDTARELDGKMQAKEEWNPGCKDGEEE